MVKLFLLERISPTINSLSPLFYNRKNHIVDRAPISVICWVYDLIVLLFSIITVNKLHNNALNPIQRRWCFRKERCISAGFVNSIESCSPTPQMVKQISHLDSWQATRQGPLGWGYKYFSQPLFVLTSGVQLINKQENKQQQLAFKCSAKMAGCVSDRIISFCQFLQKNLNKPSMTICIWHFSVTLSWLGLTTQSWCQISSDLNNPSLLTKLEETRMDWLLRQSWLLLNKCFARQR